MKKTKFLALILCLVVCLSVVTGCNLISRNDKAYYEAVVATISYKDGSKDEIRKRELLMGYNSYGYNYEQNYSQSMSAEEARKKAIEMTLESIIDQHITIKAVKEYYAKIDDKEEGKLFKETETTYLWDTTYSSVYNNLVSYYEEVTGKTIPSTQNSDQTENNQVYNAYSPKVYLDLKEHKVPRVQYDDSGDVMKDDNGNTKYETDENGDIIYDIKKGPELVLKTYKTASTIRDGKSPEYAARKIPDTEEFLDMEKESSKDFMYDCFEKLFIGKDKDSRNWKNAFNKYLKDIKNNYTYINFKNDEECFKFELNRVYEIVRDNYIVQKYSEIYNQEQHQDANTANVTVDNILKYYSSKVRADFETYGNDRAGFDSKVLTDVANMEYIYEGKDQTNFFYVGYVKLNFDETLKKAYEDAQKLGERKDEKLDEIYGSVMATERDAKGEKTSKQITATQLLNDLVDALNNKISASDKAAEFRDNFLYKYSDDDTLKNAEYNTVVGVRNNTEAVLPSAFADNEEIQDAIVALYNEGNGQVGDIYNKLVRASDGVYIFFNAGPVKNIFNVSEDFDASVDQENIRRLATTQMNIFSNKTLLDKLYDELAADNFQAFQNMNIRNLRDSLTTKIESIENNLKDLQ